MKLKIELITAIIFLLSGVLLLTNSIFITQRPVNNYILRDTVFITVESDTLSIKNVYKEILRNRIKHPEIVLRQCLMETFYLSSNICKDSNNLFGFADSKGYLSFYNYRESIMYYKIWQDKYYKKDIDYYEFLRKYPYAQDGTYIDKLKRINIDRWLK